MRADYCPFANEPCQAMCLGDCRLREHSSRTCSKKAAWPETKPLFSWSNEMESNAKNVVTRESVLAAATISRERS